MNIKLIPLLLTAVLLLTGCTATFDANPDVPAANAPVDGSQSVSAASQDPFTPDVQDPAPSQPTPDASQPAPDSTPDASQPALDGTPDAPQQTELLTREQAQAIALEQAGLTADQVTRMEVEYEIDDGIPRYEVQFRYDGWEYDYEINAETGVIISYDRDRD